MQGGFRSSEQGSDQVVRTQEIHIVVYAIGAVLMQAGTRIVLRANLPES